MYATTEINKNTHICLYVDHTTHASMKNALKTIQKFEIMAL